MFNQNSFGRLWDIRFKIYFQFLILTKGKQVLWALIENLESCFKTKEMLYFGLMSFTRKILNYWRNEKNSAETVKMYTLPNFIKIGFHVSVDKLTDIILNYFFIMIESQIDISANKLNTDLFYTIFEKQQKLIFRLYTTIFQTLTSALAIILIILFINTERHYC